jgi:hypothetical protein
MELGIVKATAHNRRPAAIDLIKRRKQLMSMADGLLNELDQEAVTTRRVLESA